MRVYDTKRDAIEAQLDLQEDENKVKGYQYSVESLADSEWGKPYQWGITIRYQGHYIGMVGQEY